jgi:TatD DNase family protein
MLIDSHCHFDLMKTATPDVLAAGQADGVTSFLNVSVDLPSFPRVRQAAHDFDNVYASVGIHPNSDQAGEADAARLVELADDDSVIAIGETGLDYFRSTGDLAWQRDRFRYHIQAAKECGKPLIIHCREAPEDTIKVLREENADQAGGIMHCFVDDWDTAQAAMDMGFLISFSGIVTFKSAKDLKEVAKKMPLEMMLVETDSPYLAPVPHRGKPNQPAFVRHVAEHIAELRETDFDTIATATTANFKRLFKLT